MRPTPLVAAVLLITAACGGAADPVATSTTPTTPSTAPATTTTTTETTTTAPPQPPLPGLTLSTGDGWTAAAVGQGIKPVLALDSTGSPALAFLGEDRMGFVSFAEAASGWTVERIAEGYFYGPIGLAFDPDDRPHVVWHDHQETTFVEQLGDLAYAVRENGSWSVEAATHDGHDGWDSTIAIGQDGVVRAAGVDPQQFGRQDGVEYYELRSGSWEVTAIGSGPIEYEWNVSLAVDPAGNPAISYFDNEEQDLRFAFLDGGQWTIETVVAEGDVGRFSSLTFDADGRPHISFYEREAATSGTIGYALRRDGEWAVEFVDTVDDVIIEHTGARRITAIALDPNGDPHIVFGNRTAVHYAIRGEGGWDTTVVATAGERPLGQLVSFALDATGVPHIATFEVTTSAPLDGIVVYLSLD